MSKKLNELRTKRNQLVNQCRSLLDKAEAEKRSLSGEDQVIYDKIFAEQEELRSQIEREERQIEAERSLASQELSKEPKGGKDDEVRGGPRATEEYRAAFGQFLRGGFGSLNSDQQRALSAGTGSEGGFMILPTTLASEMIQAADNIVLMRQWATKHLLPSAASLGAVSLDSDPDDADWTSEIGTGGEDNSMAFGKRELSPNPLAKRIKISNKLLSTVPGIESLVMQRLNYKFGVTEEKQFLLGDGNKKPLGVFTASNAGIPTSRDYATGNTSTSVTFDGLIGAKYSLKAQYQRNAKWLFHREGIRQIAMLKDEEGQYLWEPSKKAGDPDMLLGLPVFMSEYAPNTFTTGQYVGILGDFSYYWIADALDMQIQKLSELYAEQNRTGFIGRKETDGMPVLAEAFTRIKLG